MNATITHPCDASAPTLAGLHEPLPPQAWRVQIDAACQRACDAIAPTWPLDRSIAGNPHWGRIGMPVRRVAARMAVLGDIQVFPSRAYQRQAWGEQRITLEDLQLAIQRVPAATDAALTPQACIAALHGEAAIPPLPLLIDVLDQDPRRHTRLSWREAITHQVSQTCAAYFDRHQADWQPQRTHGLYAFWRDTLQHDHGIGLLMGLPRLGKALDALPASREDAERWVLRRLGLTPEVWADYLEAVLLTVQGWASWCAYLGWQARLEHAQDHHLRELLAIRLAWGAVLLECTDDRSATQAFARLQQAWSRAGRHLQEAEATLLVDEVWQTALEVGFQRSLARQLQGVPYAATFQPAPPPLMQAAFCIDVRSEPLRRALEASDVGVETLGFAGFFGLPVAYTPLATQARRPQLPGLLAPAAEVHDVMLPAPPHEHPAANAAQSPTALAQLQAAASEARHLHLSLRRPWQSASRWPAAAYSWVEAAGWGYLGALGQWLRPPATARPRDDLHGLPARYRPLCRPLLSGLDLPAQVDLAARVLHAMGLEPPRAPLVLLVGHGSQSANNAQAAALDCGACCGQTGEVNVRSLAQLLNAPQVRDGLRARGLDIPQDTTFVAALHNTSTDEIEGFDLDLLPPQARVRWDALQPALVRAGAQVRRERAPALGLDAHAPAERLLMQLRRRANDGAQTRPEWGLAGNAAFIIAPRQRSRALPLAGRCFLHDYDATRDTDGRVLELLMTAPMLVTHWINWQYHASTCDPQRLGSGNKLLHNVVGGHLGVFEGNGGDLRIGLSQQSLHNGARWVHEPLRLTVVIDAAQAAIEGVIARHTVVQQLLDNGWLHLWRFDGAQLHCRSATATWQPLPMQPQSVGA